MTIAVLILGLLAVLGLIGFLILHIERATKNFDHRIKPNAK